jgi:Uma2 family endonuclease
MVKFEVCWGMLCFEQVATRTQIRAEDYLRMTFEHDAEFVHDEIVERSMPDLTHSRIQGLMGAAFATHPLYPCLELRMKLSPDVYRVADVAIFVAKPREQRFPDTPPLVVVEILSKDDRYSDLTQKLEEYRKWGVANIWLIDPSARRFTSYTERLLQNVSSLCLPDYPFQLTPAELFADL